MDLKNCHWRLVIWEWGARKGMQLVIHHLEFGTVIPSIAVFGFFGFFGFFEFRGKPRCVGTHHLPHRFVSAELHFFRLQASTPQPPGRALTTRVCVESGATLHLNYLWDYHVHPCSSIFYFYHFLSSHLSGKPSSSESEGSGSKVWAKCCTRRFFSSESCSFPATGKR